MKHEKNKQTSSNAIIYSRVSTDEQKELGYSLQEQTQRLRQYCERENFTEVFTFEEHHSAKNFNRPEFQSILRMLKSKEILAGVLIVTKIDRFSRNAMETLMMVKELSAFNVKVFSLNDGELDFTDTAKFLPLLIMTGAAQQENLVRGDNTKRGMRQANKEGRCTGRAPLGYKNNKLTRLVEVDSYNAPFIVRGFQEVAMGTYFIDEIRKRLLKEGMKNCSKQTFLNIMRNPFYCGKIRITAWKDEAETVVKGLHEAIIDESLFNEVQAILDGKKKKIPVRITRNDNLPLRGHLVCRICSSNLTGSGSRSRNGAKHYYYHCQRGCNERFRSDVANEIFANYLGSFQVPAEILCLYDSILDDVFSAGDIERKQYMDNLDIQIRAVRAKLASLEDKFLNDFIEASDYKGIKRRIDSEEEELVEKRNEVGMEKSALKAYLEYGFPLLYNIKEYYSRASLEVKQKLIGSIFPLKLIFSENSYRTTRINEVLVLLTSNINGLGVIKTEQADISASLSTYAPRSGLEPET